MTHDPHNTHDPRRVSRATDRAVNRILDAESEGALHQARRLTREARNAGLPIDDALARTRRAVASLHALPEGIDVRSRVLGELGRAGAVVPRRARRRISAARAAVCCGLLGAFASYALVQRFAPAPPASVEAPVSHLVEVGRADLASSARSLAEALGALQDELTRPVGRMVHAAATPRPFPGEALRLGSTHAYDPPTGSLAQFHMDAPSALLTIVDVTPDGLSVRTASASNSPTRRLVDERATAFPWGLIMGSARPAPCTTHGVGDACPADGSCGERR